MRKVYAIPIVAVALMALVWLNCGRQGPLQPGQVGVGLNGVGALRSAALPDNPKVDALNSAASLDDPTKWEEYIQPSKTSTPPETPKGARGRGLALTGPNLITFSSTSFFTDTTIPGTGQAFIEGDFKVTAFWYQGGYILGHFHISSGVENHHFQGDGARQGIRIRRTDGANFTLGSIDYRSQSSLQGTPFEIGTAPLSGSVGVGTPAGYTAFPAPVTGAFTTVTITGFANVNEVWITMRGSAQWDNICLAPSNSPPVANAGPDQTKECTGPSGASVTLDGTGSSDPDGDTLTYSWSGPFGTVSGPTPTVTLPLGTHTITLTVDDGKGGTSSDTVQITVQDTTPPAVSCSIATSSLWPPNHDLVNVGLSLSATDACDASPAVAVKVYADEDDEEATGDGNHSPDAKDAGAGTLRLRSERKGDADGRVYLIVVTATDHSGNVGHHCCTVVVPHSQSKAAVASVNAQAAAAKASCGPNGSPSTPFVVGDGPTIGPKQ